MTKPNRAPKRPSRISPFEGFPGIIAEVDSKKVWIGGRPVEKPLAMAYWLIRAHFYLDAKRKGGGK